MAYFDLCVDMYLISVSKAVSSILFNTMLAVQYHLVVELILILGLQFTVTHAMKSFILVGCMFVAAVVFF
jgi:hypothetical protein